MKWSPEDDAKAIAHRMLEANTGRAAAIHSLCGWERRRFNPACQPVMYQVPAHQISGLPPIRPARSTATWCTFLVLALPLAVLAWLVRRPPRGLNIK